MKNTFLVLCIAMLTGCTKDVQQSSDRMAFLESRLKALETAAENPPKKTGRFQLLNVQLPDTPGIDYHGALKIDTETGETWKYEVVHLGATPSGQNGGLVEGWRPLSSNVDDFAKRVIQGWSK